MKQITLLAAWFAIGIAAVAQTSTPVTTRYGALAIDKSNGFYYGFSYDYTSLADAQSKAIGECKTKGGNCALVLCWSGTGCGAYRTIEGTSVGTAYGWGVAKTKAEADNIATMECTQRSNGEPALNHAYSCNSANSGALKIIYNAGTNNTASASGAGTTTQENKSAATNKKSYYANGQLKFETPVVNGKDHGISKGYYESGEL